MSWVSGIQLKVTSSVVVFADSRRARRIGDEIAVGQHHALRLAGRAGGELNEGQIRPEPGDGACRAARCR